LFVSTLLPSIDRVDEDPRCVPVRRWHMAMHDAVFASLTDQFPPYYLEIIQIIDVRHLSNIYIYI
jgi:hypothetical protein